MQMESNRTDGPLILLVEDYSDAREMYAAFLRANGFGVVEAQNGVEAVEQGIRMRPDLILMDLALPRLDGWEATRQLKADRRTGDIPVIALTGHALAGHADRARRAGCDAFIAKPCLPEALLAEINRLLDQKSSRSRQKRGAKRSNG
jgi:CheY-like chemotaxis protein